MSTYDSMPATGYASVPAAEPTAPAAQDPQSVAFSYPGATPTVPVAPVQVAPEPQQVRLNLPLITSATEETFDDVVATSQAVPVVLVLWAAQSLESKPLIATMEELAREAAGDFQLVTIDVEKSPAFIQAFQLQTLPTVLALVGGRPAPLFQGSAAKEQIKGLLEQLQQAAEQMGLSAKIAVTAEETTAPVPEEHLPILELEHSGELTAAIEAWEKLIELNPRDEAAKAHVARVRLLERAQHSESTDDPQAQADNYFAEGQQAAAFDILLKLLAETSQAEERDALRQRILDLFRVAGNTEEVKAARKKLTTLLMV